MFMSKHRPRGHVLITLFCLLTTTNFLQASVLNSYYTQYFYDLLQNNGQTHVNSESLKEELHLILTGVHYPHEGEADEVKEFSGNYLFPESTLDCLEEGSCYLHHYYDYTEARKIIFGRIYLQKNPKAQYFIHDVYCEKNYMQDDFSAKAPMGPDLIPDFHVMNLEHTWPQSHFVHDSRFPTLMQKTDLHHVFPVSSRINSSRSNTPYGVVSENQSANMCPSAKLGPTQGDPNRKSFEPPLSHKGNVARAIFYFSITYQAPVDSIQEKFLRIWNLLDPVDEQEIANNETIFKLQHTRNPFVDHPDWINAIDDF